LPKITTTKPAQEAHSHLVVSRLRVINASQTVSVIGLEDHMSFEEPVQMQLGDHPLVPRIASQVSLCPSSLEVRS